ncbi:MAG TPA: NAD(P)H-hydrate epimerase [Candidatus Aquicultor sp.]|jgi:NAD(P)H-hydrate epimerase
MKQLISVTADQMEEIERLAIYNYGFQITQIVENAGRALARVCRILSDGSVESRDIVVLAGDGKNAGGGLAAARNLHNWGANIRVVLVAHEGSLKRSALTQLNILKSMDLPIESGDRLNLAYLSKFDFIIDAILGYSAKGAPASEFASAIATANRAKRPIISLDVPSGLDATTGQVHDACIKASATIALALPKEGTLTDTATEYVGALWLADIGIPPEAYAQLGLSGDNPFIDDDLVLLRRQERAIGITA